MATPALAYNAAHPDSAAASRESAEHERNLAAPGRAFSQKQQSTPRALIHDLMHEAVRRRASDIHFEPFKDRLRVRLRVDGVLHTVREESPELSQGVTSRIKIMAGLDIAERRVPQDGRSSLNMPPGRVIDVRVSTIPAVWGEKTVLRLLDAGDTRLGIGQLGLFPQQEQHFLTALARRQGLILVTGPTGSGKTQTVFAGLNHLNRESRNIATVEDPVEIRLDGINQVQVSPRIGLDFASSLRAMLRQDPDVLLVGEIRDSETAEIALRAAHTGHLVLSTLHTNGAAETLSRLLNMGISPFNLATATRMIVAQRLLRRLCPHCKTPASDETLHEARRDQAIAAELKDTAVIYEARGCKRCLAGYHGRVGVYEVVPVSRAMSEIIIQGGSALALEAQMRRESLADLRQAALRRMAAGDTSLAEARGIL